MGAFFFIKNRPLQLSDVCFCVTAVLTNAPSIKNDNFFRFDFDLKNKKLQLLLASNRLRPHNSCQLLQLLLRLLRRSGRLSLCRDLTSLVVAASLMKGSRLAAESDGIFPPTANGFHSRSNQILELTFERSSRLPPRDVSSTSTEPPSETSRFQCESSGGGGEFLLKARVTAPRRPHESKIVVIKKPLPGKRAAETFNVIPPPSSAAVCYRHRRHRWSRLTATREHEAATIFKAAHTYARTHAGTRSRRVLDGAVARRVRKQTEGVLDAVGGSSVSNFGCSQAPTSTITCT